MREHDLLKKFSPKDEEETRISIEECVKLVMDAADRRARKVFMIYYKPIIRFSSLLKPT